METVMNYEEAVNFIMDIPRFSGKNEKELTDDFYHFLGNPGSKSKIVHVAGTNGKGSVCAFLHSICMEMGQKTGLFTSPHLVDIRERICVNREMIGKDEFLSVFQKLLDALKKFQRIEKGTEDYFPSFFEMLFFIAMLYFEEQKPDMIILETGLGGRLDATNSVAEKAVSVITEIGYDHMEYLGDTLEKIAFEKAGIIHKNVPVIFWKNRQEVTAVIEQKAAKESALCIPVSNEDITALKVRDIAIDFSYKSRYYEYIKLRIPNKAVYQTENAALALKTAETIFDRELLTPEVMQKGLLHMKWPGRMEEITPGIFLDGAHNEDGIKAFLQSVSQDGCMKRRWLLFSAVSDKQVALIADDIRESGLFYGIAVAGMNSTRGLLTEELRQLFVAFHNLSVFETVEEAYQSLLGQKTEEDYLYVAGSLYLVGQLKEYVNRTEQ